MHCLGKIVNSCQHCRGCIENKDPDKRPNNFDCPCYRALGAIIYEVKEKRTPKGERTPTIKKGPAWT